MNKIPDKQLLEVLRIVERDRYNWWSQTFPDSICSIIVELQEYRKQKWQTIDNAPKDRLILLATEWPLPGTKNWRIKTGGWREDWNKWEIFGASWKPTHWQELPEPPKE